MACITKPISNPLSLPNMCLISSKPTFTSSQISLPSSKPTTKLSFSLSLSSLTRKTHFSKVVVHVSDWSSQQEEATATVAAEPEEDVFSWGGESGADVEEREGDEEETYVEPPEEAKLFVGNLPYDVDSGKLADLFGQAGVVEIAEHYCVIHGVDSGKLAELFGQAGVVEIDKVIYNRETDQSRGFGFVTMSTVEQAEKAVEMLHQYDVNGRFLTVNKASPRGARPERTPRVFEPSYRLYVGNLPWDVDDSRLEQVFSEHGKVVNARVVYDRETGRSRGFGFITMESESELNDAISNLDGQDLGGRAIKVNVAEERARRPY